MTDAPQQNFSSRLWNNLKELVDSHHLAEGCGRDAYNDAPAAHPMAEAKFLSTLAVLRETGKLTDSAFRKMALPSVERLSRLAIQAGGGRKLWGLGFSWREMTAKEPFLITTALVVRGLLDAHSAGLEDSRFNLLLEEGLEGLLHWCDGGTVVPGGPWEGFPAYSHSIVEPIFNAAAMACATLAKAEESGVRNTSAPARKALLSTILKQHIKGVGFPYSPTNPVIDVVHQGYIINSARDFFGSGTAHPLALDLFGQFTCPGGMADSFKFSTKAFQPQPDREMPVIRAVPKGYLLLNQKPARLWSLGEALVLVSTLAEDSRYGTSWLRFGRVLSGWLFDRLENPLDVERAFPRHRMHAAHGLAALLKALRAGA